MFASFTRHVLFHGLLPALCLTAVFSCGQKHEHIAPAVSDSDSLPAMTAHGISNLISDSGIISYKIVAEDWNIYNTDPQKWTFLKGLFLEKFDSTFHVQWYVQADTAYCHANRIWELRGRVVVLNRNGDLMETEELFWDMDAHELWNHVYMCITMPHSDQQLKGYHFRSDEQMTKYSINNSTGYTPINEKKEEETATETTDPSESPVSNDSRRPSQADNHRDASQSTANARANTESQSTQP
ncbi:MAG: LPS export ABC transporter periplasmic protein LptC [Bacteroidales bacterium]|nr:LPS export ABC transporter periplasmic protein LptC [Bacteroidales bacterium]